MALESSTIQWHEGVVCACVYRQCPFDWPENVQHNRMMDLERSNQVKNIVQSKTSSKMIFIPFITASSLVAFAARVCVFTTAALGQSPDAIIRGLHRTGKENVYTDVSAS